MFKFNNLPPRPSLKFTSIIVLTALYYSLVFNFPLIKKVYELSQDGAWFAYTGPLVLLCAFTLIFSLLAWPYFFKPVMVLFTVTSAIALYAQVNYNVMFDSSMIENVFETNVSEASFYINANSFLYVIGLGILPSILLCWVKLTYHSTFLKEVISRIILLALAVIFLIIIAFFTYKDYASVGRNNRYLNKMIIPAHVYNTYQYINKNYLQTPIKYKNLGDDATLSKTENNKPTLVIFVLGETARSMNYSQNGYARDTQPYTKDKGLISLQYVSSCGTYTALSVPCMFSNMDRKNYNKAKANAQDNVIDIIAKANINTLWIDNDGGDKGVAKNTTKISTDPTSDPELCNGDTCIDEIMLPMAKQFLDSELGDKMLVMHAIGSHGPTYFQRFPTKMGVFAPWCDRKDIEQCSDEEIINVYDNTIRYTDYFLAKVIDMLDTYSDRYNVVMMYVSDHGESLGEKGFYLHGTPYSLAPKEQTHVPWLIWMPDQYAQQKHIDKVCLQQQAQQDEFSHDNLFHSLLGLVGVKTKEKDPQKDIFNLCQAS